MQKLKKDLQAVTQTLKALTQKVEKMQAQMEKAGKSKPAAKKPVKKATAKKAAPKKTGAKKVAPKKSVTAVDTVLGIINKSKKGIDTSALMQKTGYDKKKIANLVFKLKKQGKIKSETKGVYVKA